MACSSADVVAGQALKRTSLVPIRVEFETETHRIRDCFVWNLNESSIKPESFARIFCNDMDLPLSPWAETIAAQIRSQLEEYQDVAAMELGMDGAIDFNEMGESTEELPECRVVLSVSLSSSFPKHQNSSKSIAHRLTFKSQTTTSWTT